ncbi:MAG: methionyl-tRNA formyltransferase [Candidatus Omnitrophota bacterium]
MKIVFFGSSDFGVAILEALKDKEDVALVVTQPDRKRGRSLKLCATPVKEAADRLGIKTFQPEDVNSRDSIGSIKGLKPELFIVVSFGEILSRELLDTPGVFSINVHASLLPSYRGAAPINWVLANGEKETGVTIIKMNERMDEGEIILKEACSIDSSEDAISLSKRLSIKAVLALLHSIDLIKKKEVSFTEQDKTKVTYAPKLKRIDGLIDWGWSAEKIYNRVRAFVPWPVCFTHWGKRVLKIWKANPERGLLAADSSPGMVLDATKDGIFVGTGEGILGIKELQMEGKRRMSAGEFIAGHKDMGKGTLFLLQE